VPFSQGELRKREETFIDFLFSDSEHHKPAESVSAGELREMVLCGGYPELVERSTQQRREAWARNYITTILQRDIRELANVDGLTVLPGLLHILAARTANLLNLADVARSLQIPQSSLKRYIALLEATFLINRVAAWSGNFTSRLTKAPKIHLNDTGLVSFLLGVDSKRLEENSPLAGQMFETFVFNEILKQASWSRSQPRLYHFRTTSGKEVDIVLENSRGECIGIEVKSSASVSAKDVEGLRTLQEAAKKNFVRGVVLYTGKEIVPFDASIHALPLLSLWSSE